MARSDASHTVAYLLIEVPAKKSGDVARRLVDEFRQYVVETHAVWGESDVVAKVSVPNPGALAELVMGDIQKLTFVTGTRTFITIEDMHYQTEPTTEPGTDNIDAFVFINVDAARSEEIAKFLVSEFPDNVMETYAVWGGADVIARITAKNMNELSELIMSAMQNVRYVSVTRTYLIVPGLSEYSKSVKQTVYENKP